VRGMRYSKNRVNPSGRACSCRGASSLYFVLSVFPLEATGPVPSIDHWRHELKPSYRR
jgi:hypothetical protein